MSTEEGSPLVVLVHSPLVGPTTWAPVARRLRARGHDVRVPVFTRVCEGEDGFVLKPDDVEGLAAKLDWLATHRQAAVAMGERAAVHAHAAGAARELIATAQLSISSTD